MKIGVDLHVLQGINQGSKTYLDNLYTWACKLNQNKHEFFFYFNDANKVQDKWRNFGEIRQFGTRSRFGRLIFDASIRQRQDGVRAFHSQYVCPLMSLCDDFVTIHDVLYETHPEFFTKAFVLRSRLMIKRSASIARHVFTVSEYSRQKLIECYGIPENKISITSNGVNREEFAVDRDQAVAFIKNKYKISDYILSVGRLEPRKNHIGLLNAYIHLKKRYRDLPPLVLVGQRDFGFIEIFKIIQEHGLESSVHVIENADFHDLVRLYRSALCFAYPSFAEGFGIPPLEAMAAGCPVICSKTTAMGEIFGEAAELVDPYDLENLSDAILRVVDDAALRQRMRLKNDIVVDRYHWRNAAANLVSIYDTYGN